MARIRSDKPEAYQSETLAEISLAAERTFKGMATIADDRSRLPDKPAQINGELWAMRGNHTREDLEAELAEMIRVGLICRYIGCDGKRYLHMPSWDQHQKIDRPSKSRLPRCPRHPTEADDCGKHKGDCEPIDTWTFDAPSRESREGSRGLQQPENGLDAVAAPFDAFAAPVGSPIEGERIPAGAGSGQANGHHPPDQEQQESSRESREGSRDSPPLDLGSRTLDRGSNAASRAGAREAQAASILGSSLLDEHTGQIRPRPPRDVTRRTGEQIDLLLGDSQIAPDDIRGGLALLRAKPKLGPGALSSLVHEFRQETAHPELAAGRASPRRPGNRGASDPLTDQQYGQGSTNI